MEFKTHHIAETEIAEVASNNNSINQTDDSLNLLGNLFYQGFNKIIIFEKSITPHFFDLKTGIAGEILQKVSMYRVRLAIVGDFTQYKA